jgi:hypothetical protein
MRQERAIELEALLQTRAGRIRLWDLFGRYFRRTGGHLPPSGPVLVEAILSYEFPCG